MKSKTTSSDGTQAAIEARASLIAVWEALITAGAPRPEGTPDAWIAKDSFRESAKNLVSLFPTPEVKAAERACIRLVNACVVMNTGLIHLTIKKFRGAAAGRGIDQEELFQEGAIGLQHAIEKFEPHLGFAFSTYAGFWIRQAMGRYIDNYGPIRVPVRTNQLSQKGDHGNARYIQEALNAIKRVQSIHTPIAPDAMGQEVTLLDTMHSELTSPDAALEEAEDHAVLRGLIAGLTDREMGLLRARFVDERTLEDIGKDFGVTRERVRQLEAKLLCKLKTRAILRKKETNGAY